MLARKMRIAIVTTHPPGAGSLNEYAYHFVRYLRHEKQDEISEVILLTDELPPGDEYDLEPAVVPVEVVPCWRFGALNNATRIRAAVKQVDPDCVLFNIQFASFGSGKVAASAGLTAPGLVKRAGYPTIVLLHNIMETVDLESAGFAGNPIMERLIRTSGTVMTRGLLSADLVALTIPKYVEILEEKYGTDNVVLAPHGAFAEPHPPSFELPDGPVQIMTFGKFGTYKQIETLIEAFQLLQQELPQPLELVVAGTDSPNAQGYLDGVRSRYGHVPNMRFTGYVAESDVATVFGEAAVVVFPYTSTTGSSGVLHQAGDYGKAVVLPNIGDFAEVITEEGYAGEFFAPGDPKSLAAAIHNVIGDAEHRRSMGMRNWRAASGLPMSEVVDWYLLHFQNLINEKEMATGQ